LTWGCGSSKFTPVKHLSDLASVLVAQAPRQHASNVLSFLVNRARASGGALLTFRDQSLVLFCSTPDLQAASVVRAWGAWDAHRQRIESGETIQTPDQVLAPLKDDGALVGLLHLDAPQGFDSSLLSTFGLVLAKAVQTDLTADRGLAVAEIVDVPEQSKDRLVSLLHRNEWNIARVARVMGVTRRTIYLRLKRYGIDRQVVPRSNTSRQPRTATV
jgi:Bacterial regulatory protein, Fis family